VSRSWLAIHTTPHHAKPRQTAGVNPPRAGVPGSVFPPPKLKRSLATRSSHAIFLRDSGLTPPRSRVVRGPRLNETNSGCRRRRREADTIISPDALRGSKQSAVVGGKRARDTSLSAAGLAVCAFPPRTNLGKMKKLRFGWTLSRLGPRQDIRKIQV
jgi:hypothetical protein